MSGRSTISSATEMGETLVVVNRPSAIPASPLSAAEDSLRLVREESPMSALMTFSASQRARR